MLLRRVLELQRRQLLLQARQLLLHLAQARLARGILLRLQCRRLDLQLQLPALQLVDDLGRAVERHAHARGRLIEKVDRAVGQAARGDVALRQLGRQHQGCVLNDHAVVRLVALLDAAQDADGVRHGGLVDHHGLHAPREGLVCNAGYGA